MKFTIRNMPPILDEPEKGRVVLHEELSLARDQIGREYRGAVILAIHDTKPHKPIDWNTLVDGIGVIDHPTHPLGIRVSPSPLSNPYSVVMEMGRRPGRPGPPLAPILAWVQHRLGLSGKAAASAAFLIRRKIHVKGTKGRFFMRRARKSTTARKTAVSLVRAAIARWKARVA